MLVSNSHIPLDSHNDIPTTTTSTETTTESDTNTPTLDLDQMVLIKTIIKLSMAMILALCS